MSKICHFSSLHPPRDPRIYEKECRSLAKAGYEVHLLVPNTPSTKTEEGVFLHGLDLPLNRWKRLLFGHRRMRKQLLAINAELYHFHDPELLPLGWKLRKKGKTVVYDAHEDLPRQMLSKAWLPPWLRKPLAFLAEKLENFFAGQMSAVVTPTPHLQQRFAKVNSRSVQVANFTQLDETALPPFAERPKKLLYVGTLLKVRGIAEMIEASAEAGYPLHLAGNWHSDSYESYCKNLPGWSNVCFHGYIGPEKKRELLADSRIGLVLLHPIPNYLLAWPVKLFEYMAAGLPVIASDFPLWQEIVQENDCGICVNPMDKKQIVQAIRLFMEDDNMAEQMGRKGQLAARQKYHWNSQEKNLLALYDEILR